MAHPTRIPSMPPSFSLRVALIAFLCALTACERPAAQTWPTGTAFALDGMPITAEEIDVSADIIAQLEPDSVTTQARRIAFTNIVLPRAAGILAAGAERETARKKAFELKRELDGSATQPEPPSGVLLQDRVGVATDIGLEAWSHASTAPFGTWSDPIETVGAFEVVRVDERSNANSARQVRYKVRVYFVPYLEPTSMRASIEERLDRATLLFVDPTWAEIVPEALKHRLHAGAP